MAASDTTETSAIIRTTSVVNRAYRITLGDTSHAPIVSLPRNRKNYYSWSRMLLMVIGARNKFSFLDGSITRPASIDSNFSA